MKLEKAIEILELNVREVGTKMPDDTLHALKLGIEALKRIQSKRITMSYHPDDFLPGETK